MKNFIKILIALTVLLLCVGAIVYALAQRSETKYIKLSDDEAKDLLTLE